MESLIAIDKALYFIQKARVACQVRESHLLRGKREDTSTTEVKKKILELENWLNYKLEEIIEIHPAHPWFSKVRGIGGINIGKVICLIEIEKCPTISSLWRYAIGAPIGGVVEKRKKGEKLHYNQMLKTMCWRLGKSLIRANGKYADFYRSEKTKIIVRFQEKGSRVIPSAKLPQVKGKKVEKDGKIALGHVDQMAMRKMIKLFLSHLWLVWRRAVDLPISEPYAFAHLGHDGYIAPEDMIED
jgi:hypothetical protein